MQSIRQIGENETYGVISNIFFTENQ